MTPLVVGKNDPLRFLNLRRCVELGEFCVSNNTGKSTLSSREGYRTVMTRMDTKTRNMEQTKCSWTRNVQQYLYCYSRTRGTHGDGYGGMWGLGIREMYTSTKSGVEVSVKYQS